MRRPIIAALGVALSLILAAPAAADSISYLKDGNIWLTTPDASRQVQVTKSGIYSYASQADDGTFIALTGERLHKLSRDGKVLADFDTPVSDGPKKGPFENYFNAGRAFAEEAVVNQVGVGKGDKELIRWLDSTFDMDEVYQLRDGELTRKGDKAAFVSYDVGHHGDSFRVGFNRVRVYRLTGPPPKRPEACFYFDGPDQADLMSSPSFSPDGSMLVMQFGGGLSIADIPDLSQGCQSPTFFKDLIAGAQPDWGPADVPVATNSPVNPPAPSPGPIVGPAPPAPKPPTIGVTLPKGGKLRTALRKGVAFTVRPGAAGRVTATAKLKRSKVASVTGKVGVSGKAKLRLRFTSKAARTLRGRRSVRLAITVRFTPAGGSAPVTRSVRLTLRR